MEKLKVGVMGALGKMGKEVCRAVIGDDALTLTGAYALEQQGMDIGPLIGLPEYGVKVGTNLTKLQEEAKSNEYLNQLKEQDNYETIKEALIPKEYNLIVTPKEIDDLIENMSEVVAKGINMAM